MKQSDDLKIKYIDQRYDGFEAWIRFKECDWIRLDAFLEYYLSQNVDLTKEYNEKLGDKSLEKQYQNKLFNLFSEKTSSGKDFDFEKYFSWVNNPSEISKVLKLLNS